MTRNFIAVLLSALMVGLLFSAASADTLTKVDITAYPGFTVNEYILTMDSGGADTTALPYKINGEVLCIDTVPGASAKAPTANYDLQLRNDLGVDVMGGSLANRHTSNAERAWPMVGAAEVYVGVPTRGTLSVYRENNQVQDAEVTIRIYVKNQHRNWR